MTSRLTYGLILLGVTAAGCSSVATVRQDSRSQEDVSREIRRVRVSQAEGPELARLAAEIKAFLGAPYRWGGTSVRGVDCSGLVQTIFQKVYGISLPRTSRDLFRTGAAVRRPPLRLGDLVFFRTNGKNSVSHVGIYLGQGKFVHASTSRGVRISDLTQRYYSQRFLGARRVMKSQKRDGE